MSELKKYKLGDLGFFFGGVTSIKKEDYGHGTPFLPYKNVYKNSKVNVNELELMNVRPLDLDRRNAVYGDIFFTASSETPDEVAMSSVLLDEVENLTFNGFCKRFRLNDFNTLLPEYARYLFRDISFRREVYQLATGDIRFNISQESLANIEIEIPDTTTQKKIAQILTSLDDKIELNLQMNQTLEAMAQAIFKEWFVNFNFPGFDGELVDGLPKGWRMGKLGECVTIKRGGSPRPIQEFLAERGLRWLKISDVTSLQTPFILETKEYIKEEGLSKTTLLKSGSLVLSNSATPGIPKILHVDSCIHDGWLHFPNSIFSNEFLYLKFLELRRELVQKANGSIFTNLKTDIVRDFDIIIPGENILTEFDNVMKPIFKKLLENTLQIKALTQTRDTLLPKLMSGQLKIV